MCSERVDCECLVFPHGWQRLILHGQILNESKGPSIIDVSFEGEEGGSKNRILWDFQSSTRVKRGGMAIKNCKRLVTSFRDGP